MSLFTKRILTNFKIITKSKAEKGEGWLLKCVNRVRIGSHLCVCEFDFINFHILSVFFQLFALKLKNCSQIEFIASNLVAISGWLSITGLTGRRWLGLGARWWWRRLTALTSCTALWRCATWSTGRRCSTVTGCWWVA